MAVRCHVTSAGMLSELDSVLVMGNCLSTRSGLNQLSLPCLPTANDSDLVRYGVSLLCLSCPMLDAWGWGQKPQAGNSESLMTGYFFIVSEYHLLLEYTKWYFHTNKYVYMSMEVSPCPFSKEELCWCFANPVVHPQRSGRRKRISNAASKLCKLNQFLLLIWLIPQPNEHFD